MKTSFFTIFTVSISLFSGCTTSQQKDEMMQSFVGQHYSEAIVRWGPPTQVIDNTNGGQIVSWQDTSAMTMPGYGSTTYYDSTNTAYTTYHPGNTLTFQHSKTFWTDPNGIVIKWAWRDADESGSYHDYWLRFWNQY